jgi:radical SAM enzyme (TIGR01210 family)
MCDLWRHTLAGPTPAGAIPAQLDHARARLAGSSPLPPRIKLYNAGSFFDARAVPRADHSRVAAQLAGYRRVVVESHPVFVGDAARRFRDALTQARLEVAMGLETAHPAVLARLGKRMTLGQYAAAAERLRRGGMDLRSFVLVQPPFMPAAEAVAWAVRSVDFAFDCGATVVVLIPTRGGNGAMEALSARGDFQSPTLATVEAALAAGLQRRRGRVFVDTWDLARLADCPTCSAARLRRLATVNLTQQFPPLGGCPQCGIGTH